MTERDFWDVLLTALVLGVLRALWPARGGGADAARLDRLEQRLEALERSGGVPPAPLDTGGAAPVPHSDGGLPAGVLDELRRGRKIDAIKIYRQATGVGLKDAKDAVERFEADLKARGLL